MPCNPLDNNLHPAPLPPLPIPPFGLPFAPIQLPIPGFSLPEGFPEDLLDFIDNLTIPWPGGEFSPNIDDLANTLLKYLSDIFSQIAPFLSLYNFFMALLNMILCIIEVLCAIPNPWAMIRAIRRLIKRCLPPFLNLFPWLALLAMILALLLLLLALIEYIIARILQIIEDLLRNLQLLADGVTLQDAESTAATAFKIASLLCIIEALMAVFSSVAAILAIIEALANIRGRTVCAKSGGSSNDVECCGDDVCPPFIADNPDGIPGTQGRLVYHNQIIANPLAGGFFTRPESWQFVNDATGQQYPFKDIITQYSATYGDYGDSGASRSQSGIYEDGDIFWPEGISFESDTTLRRAPYTVTMTLRNYNPNTFVSSDTGGARDIIVRNAIVAIKPYIGVRDEDNNLDTANNSEGTLSLLGGIVTEVDGTPLTINGIPATLQSLIHTPINLSGQEPSSDDAYTVDDISFVLNINHAALINYNLVTLGCIPDMRKELDIINTTYREIDPVIMQVPNWMPDVSGTQACVANALSELRKDVSIEKVEQFREVTVACLESLRDETVAGFCSTFEAAVDPFQSEIAIDPDVQFVTRPISVEVLLRDIGGVNISTRIPEDCRDDLASLLTGTVTLGEISDFEWDGYIGKFVAEITAEVGGSGELQIAWKGNIFSVILNRDSVDEDTAVEEIVVPYTFVGTGSAVAGDSKTRRDATDVANSGE